jgi:hypothetical protein
MKLKDWPRHVEELIRLRPDLAEAHVVQEVRCERYEDTMPIQLWDPESLPAKDLVAEHLKGGPKFIYPEVFEWGKGEYSAK